MSVATVPASAPPSAPISPRRDMSPHSILRPCSSVVQPSKDAAGNRAFGWLAAPPRELTQPRPSPVVVKELQPQQAQTFTAPAHALLHGSPTSEPDGLGAVPTLSPSVSQDSVADSVVAPSLPESLDHSHSHSHHDGELTPRSSAPSPSIRFGALPERPPELRRANSISLGVLARKSMLHAQGSIPQQSPQNQANVRRIMMTDDEWEAYQRQFAAKNQTSQAVDLGAVMKSGARSFFGKLRRGSNASTTSTTSTASTTATTASAPARVRSDSAPTAPPVNSPNGGARAASRDRVAIAPPVLEEPEEAGDETPRGGRSPDPPSPTQCPEGALPPVQTGPALSEMTQYAGDGRPALPRSASGA